MCCSYFAYSVLLVEFENAAQYVYVICGISIT